MKITWLGQAGLLFETASARVLIDPYLSDSVAALDPAKHRRFPADLSFLTPAPDFLLFTHDHLDHYDPETVEPLLKGDAPMTVLCPSSVWGKVRKYGGVHNYVQFDRHSIWTDRGLRFTAVRAVHSDAAAIGFLIDDLAEGKTYYVTGDTLYSTELFADLPDDIEAIFLPVNGVGNNMNMTDAAEFAHKTHARYVVPLHFGLFDRLNMLKFHCPNKVVPVMYHPIFQ